MEDCVIERHKFSRHRWLLGVGVACILCIGVAFLFRGAQPLSDYRKSRFWSCVSEIKEGKRNLLIDPDPRFLGELLPDR
jgi:hypothetical protein